MDSENVHDDWVSLEYKQIQLKRLESAAKYIEYYFPRYLRSGDFATDALVKETARQLAAALRNKKMWIFTPKKDTNEFFIKSIAFTLICILKGNWDDLERIEPMKTALPELRHSILVFFLNLFKALFVAGLPIVGVIILQQTQLALSGVGRDYVVLGLFVWVLLTLIVVLDPNYSSKISAIRDIINLLLPSRTDQRP